MTRSQELKELSVPMLLELLNIMTRLSNRQGEILYHLAKAFPGSLSMNELVDKLYGDDPDGGPNWASHAVAATTLQLRKRLDGTNWTIPKHWGGACRNSRFTLVYIPWA